MNTPAAHPTSAIERDALSGAPTRRTLAQAVAGPRLALGRRHVVQLSKSLGQPVIDRRSREGALALRPRQRIVAVVRLQVITAERLPFGEKLLQIGFDASLRGDRAAGEDRGSVGGDRSALEESEMKARAIVRCIATVFE